MLRPQRVCRGPHENADPKIMTDINKELVLTMASNKNLKNYEFY